MNQTLLIFLAFVPVAFGDLVLGDMIPYDETATYSRQGILVLVNDALDQAPIVHAFQAIASLRVSLRSADWSAQLPNHLFVVAITTEKQVYLEIASGGCIAICIEPTCPLFSDSSYWFDQFVWRLNSVDPERLVQVLHKITSNPTENEREFMRRRIIGVRVQQSILRFNRDLANSVPCQSPARFSIFLAIVSARGHYEKRSVIRETWLKSFASTGVIFRYRFFVGTSPGISIESKGDVVELDVPELYSNLGSKVRSMYHYIAQHFGDSSHLVRTDDDIYIRPFPVVERLRGKPWCRSWWGFFTHVSFPIRDEAIVKGFIPYDKYPYDAFFPSFTRGYTDSITMDILLAVVEKDINNQFTRKIHFDDVQLGYFIAQLVKEDGFSVVQQDGDEAALPLHPECVLPGNWQISTITNATWSVHHVNASQVECMWKADVSAGYLDETGSVIQNGIPNLPNLCLCASNWGHSGWTYDV
jgi:hypothetical protein